MKLNKCWPYLLLTGITAIFFYKTIFFGLLPFPGDLLLSEYNPWRHASYDGYYPGAIPSKAQYFDVLRELYPWKHLAIEEMKQGRLPLWNPYNFSGNPLLANDQSAALYPLNILFFLLPFDIAWSTLVILQPLLGSFFFFLFATTIGITPRGAILGAIAFNYGSFANVWMEFNTVWHTILWLPLILWCIEKRKTFLLSVAVFMSATAGHPQDFLYVLGFSLIYMISRRRLLITGILGGLGLAAVQILPTIELFLKSARVPHDYQFIMSNMLIPPWQLIKMFVPDFFGNPATKTYFLQDTYVSGAISIGLVGVLLAITAIVSRSLPWHRKFFLWSAFGILLLTVRTPLTELFYRFPIPILSTGSPSRMLSLFAISLAVLTGIGWDTLSKNPKTFLRGAAIVACILIAGWITALLLSSPTSQRSMLLASAVFVAGFLAIIFIPKKLQAPVVTMVLVTELLFAFLKFNPFVPRSFVFPPHPLWNFLSSQKLTDRFWGYGTAQMPYNVSTYFHIQSPDGIDPLNLKLYNQFIQGSHNGTIARTFTRFTRSDAFIAPGYGEHDLAQNPSRLRILDALGVRFVIDRIENAATAITFPPDRFAPVWKDDGWTVFENTKVAPRYFLTHRAVLYRTPEEFERLFFSPDFNVSDTVLISIQDQLPLLQSDPTKQIKLLRYTPSQVTFETTTKQLQLLYLSDADDGNWRAEIDGISSPVLRANWSFRAVLVPAGTHTIDFLYLPKSFLWAVAISGITLVILLVAAGATTIRTIQQTRSQKFLQ
ncbi:YfhO family protein [Candidatus Gottesmanbacteria bacterium]|nr:YfhO family protein [Candidatus Gottesmanbacteria bacterium]